MLMLEIFDAMVNHLDFFLHHRHAARKIVVLAYLARQLVELGFHDGL